MHFPALGADGDQSKGNEVAKVEGKEPETKGVLTSQPSKVSSRLAMKIGPNADRHMISPPLLSHCWYHPVLFDRHPNKIVNLPFP